MTSVTVQELAFPSWHQLLVILNSGHFNMFDRTRESMSSWYISFSPGNSQSMSIPSKLYSSMKSMALPTNFVRHSFVATISEKFFAPADAPPMASSICKLGFLALELRLKLSKRTQYYGNVLLAGVCMQKVICWTLNGLSPHALYTDGISSNALNTHGLRKSNFFTGHLLGNSIKIGISNLIPYVSYLVTFYAKTIVVWNLRMSGHIWIFLTSEKVFKASTFDQSPWILLEYSKETTLERADF